VGASEVHRVFTRISSDCVTLWPSLPRTAQWILSLNRLSQNWGQVQPGYKSTAYKCSLRTGWKVRPDVMLFN